MVSVLLKSMLETEIGLQKTVSHDETVLLLTSEPVKIFVFSFRADLNYSKFLVYHWIHPSLNHCYMNLN